MVKAAFFIMFIALLIQSVSLTCVIALLFRYKVETLGYAVGFLFCNFVTSVATSYAFLEWNYFSIWSDSLSDKVLIVHIIAMYGLIFFLTGFVCTYLNNDSKVLSAISAVFPLVMIMLTILYRHNIHRPYYIESVFFTVSSIFFLFLLGTVFLLLISLIKKTTYSTYYTVLAIVMIVLYLPLGMLDCYWPLFRTIHLFKPNGFSFSIILSIILGIEIVFLSFPFVIYNEEKKYNLKEFSQTFELTRREVEVLSLIINGEVNHSIADELEISYSTVKKHVYSIFQKTRSHSRVELINLCRLE